MAYRVDCGHAPVANTPDDPARRPDHSKAKRAIQRRHQETADNYVNIVVRLNESWRVVICRDGFQYILQRRRGERCGQARWTGVSYHRTRKSLIRVSHAMCGEIDPAAMTILAALPERIGGEA